MEKDGECKCVYPFDIRCTKLYVKYGEGMLCYCSIPIYPHSIYMISLNLLHSPRRKLSMKLQPHLPVQCDCSPPPLSSSLPSLPHAPLLSLSFPFSPPSFLSPFPSLPLSCTPPPSVFPMDCLPIDCICTSLFIIPPPSPILSYLFLPYIWRRHVRAGH